MRTTKIYALALAQLPNDKHMAFTDFMARALRKFSIADTSLAVFVAAFFKVFDKETAAFMRIDRKALSQRIKDADVARINALRTLHDLLKIYLIQTDAQKKALAERILEVLNLYGGTSVYYQHLDSRTGNITNIVEDMEGKLSDAVEALNLQIVIQTLKAANEQFIQSLEERDQSDADYGKGTMAEARTETDNAWRAIVDTANWTIAYGEQEEAEALVPFANYINVEINRYRVQTGQGVGGGSNSSTNRPSDGEGEGGGETEKPVVMKNATFKKADGTSVVIPFAVGAPIEFPTNTVGYKWSPNLEVMPKTNKTFKEVPIVDRETIALFHFADHTEEEIKQFVGTLLHAPANTTGCYWSPEVPELMPAEDTQYYELPIENDDNQGGDQTGGDQGGSTGGGNNGGYPPGYDPDADLDPGV